MAVKEWNDEIIFVRQVTPGASERSFGIQVARLAGLPDGVVERAKQILGNLEVGDSQGTPAEVKNETPSSGQTPPASTNLPEKKPKTRRVAPQVDPSQLELF